MPKTYNDLYLATRTALKSAGVEAYALEARLLVAYAVGKTKEEFVRDLRLYTSDENEQKIRALLQRRIAGEPLAYLIGEWEFHGLPITVTPDVLIPRMDTEVLVDAALQVLVGRKMNARILDLCSGSGCIGCALAHELPAARVVMVDISDAALAVSKENLRRNRQNRTICLKADALEKPPMSIGTRLNLISKMKWRTYNDKTHINSYICNNNNLCQPYNASCILAYWQVQSGC